MPMQKETKCKSIEFSCVLVCFAATLYFLVSMNARSLSQLSTKWGLIFG